MAMLTTKDVCDQLSISRSSVGRLVTDGELPCYKLGKSLRYYQSDVLKGSDNLFPFDSSNDDNKFMIIIFGRRNFHEKITFYFFSYRSMLWFVHSSKRSCRR